MVTAMSGFVIIYDAPLTDETAANARLIAAAPDMLRALQRLEYFHSCNDTPNSNPWEEARNAIAKATSGGAYNQISLSPSGSAAGNNSGAFSTRS